MATSLDPLETADDLSTKRSPHHHGAFDELTTSFRHAGWQPYRKAIANALKAADAPEERQERFKWCGANAWVLYDQTDPSILTYRADFCHDRFCVPCQKAKTQVVQLNLRSSLPPAPLRFLTLTLKASQTPLASQVQRIIEAFKRLRTRKEIRTRIKGGIWFLEITRNDNTHTWHVHLHTIVQGAYLPHDLVSKLWHEVTHDSYIIDVRFIHNADEAAAYVCKYTQKGLTQSVYRNEALLTELILALQGTRSFNAFGEWTHFSLCRPPKSGRKWIFLEPLGRTIQMHQSGVPAATAILTKVFNANLILQLMATNEQPPPETP